VLIIILHNLLSKPRGIIPILYDNDTTKLLSNFVKNDQLLENSS